MKEQIKQLTLRIPASDLRLITEYADTERRPLNQAIVYLAMKGLSVAQSSKHTA